MFNLFLKMLQCYLSCPDYIDWGFEKFLEKWSIWEAMSVKVSDSASESFWKGHSNLQAYIKTIHKHFVTVHGFLAY